MRHPSFDLSFRRRRLPAGKFLTVFLLLLGLASPAAAQWVTQTIRLVPGYNPVFLQVSPADPACDTLFGALPQVTEVWMYNRYLQTATITTNATQAAVGQDHWLTWYPGSSEKKFLATLAQIRGGQSYLIKLAPNSPTLTLNIKGIPIPPRSDWIPNDFVLAGFPINETNRVNFYDFLKDSPQVAALPGQDSAIFTINPTTAFETQVRNPELTKIVPGKAYWAFLQGHTHHPYPFEALGGTENNAVQFLQDSPVTTLTLKSGSADAHSLHLRLLDGEAPPAGKPSNAGTPPIVALLPRADGSFAFQRLASGVDISVDGGASVTLRLGVLLRELPMVSDTNATYQALIEVTEAGHGYRQLVPVVAEVPGSKLFNRQGSLMGTPGSRRKADLTDAVATTAQNAGLWVGTVTFNAVNLPGFDPAPYPDPGSHPVIAATPLNTRVLIHVDSNGVSRLVQQIIFADVSDGTNRVTRMYSSLANVPAGATLKSRLSAPSWPAVAPATLAGNFGFSVAGTVSTPYNDSLNPFVHRYHPDHNNLAEDFSTPLAAGVESFDITRNVSFYFGDTIRNGTGFAPAVPAVKFSGAAGEYVSASAFSTTPGLTVQFWLNIATLQQNGGNLVLLTNATQKTQVRLGFVANTGTLALTVSGTNGATGQLVTTNALPTGAWINVTAAYDGVSAGQLFVNGVLAGQNYLPALPSGAWDLILIGNAATTGSGSFVGEIHDVVVRNGATASQNVPQLMVVPQLLDSTGIVLDLLGSSVTTNVINHGTATVTVATSGTQLIDLASAPTVPPYTSGTAQGTYQETIAGLRRQAITVQGSFQFTRVSQNSTLY
ncbi:MAG TPA: LamG domain-containing protein [Candidatus Limnocylindria bacterium]|nr:LamG domain-containing protein [Candidatus Limnocylindria bacterium]